MNKVDKMVKALGDAFKEQESSICFDNSNSARSWFVDGYVDFEKLASSILKAQASEEDGVIIDPYLDYGVLGELADVSDESKVYAVTRDSLTHLYKLTHADNGATIQCSEWSDVLRNGTFTPAKKVCSCAAVATPVTTTKPDPAVAGFEKMVIALRKHIAQLKANGNIPATPLEVTGEFIGKLALIIDEVHNARRQP